MEELVGLWWAVSSTHGQDDNHSSLDCGGFVFHEVSGCWSGGWMAVRAFRFRFLSCRLVLLSVLWSAVQGLLLRRRLSGLVLGVAQWVSFYLCSSFSWLGRMVVVDVGFGYGMFLIQVFGWGSGRVFRLLDGHSSQGFLNFPRDRSLRLELSLGFSWMECFKGDPYQDSQAMFKICICGNVECWWCAYPGMEWSWAVMTMSKVIMVFSEILTEATQMEWLGEVKTYIGKVHEVDFESHRYVTLAQFSLVNLQVETLLLVAMSLFFESLKYVALSMVVSTLLAIIFLCLRVLECPSSLLRVRHSSSKGCVTSQQLPSVTEFLSTLWSSGWLLFSLPCSVSHPSRPLESAFLLPNSHESYRWQYPFPLYPRFDNVRFLMSSCVYAVRWFVISLVCFV